MQSKSLSPFFPTATDGCSETQLPPLQPLLRIYSLSYNPFVSLHLVLFSHHPHSLGEHLSRSSSALDPPRILSLLVKSRKDGLDLSSRNQTLAWDSVWMTSSDSVNVSFALQPPLTDIVTAWVNHPGTVPELLFIRRSPSSSPSTGSSSSHGRWSSHIAFPGGRHEPNDESALYTALRETWEEIGIDLAEREFVQVGRLDEREITTSLGKRLLMILSPFGESLARGIRKF